jgi:hypothetical protein
MRISTGVGWPNADPFTIKMIALEVILSGAIA